MFAAPWAAFLLYPAPKTRTALEKTRKIWYTKPISPERRHVCAIRFVYSHILYSKRVKLLVYCSFILLKILFEHSKKCLRSDFLRGKEPFIMKKTVCVIFGGASSEYEVSLMSSASIIRNLDTEKFDILTLGITKDGRWLLYSGAVENIENNTWMNSETARPAFISPDKATNGLVVLNADGSYTVLKVDVLFPVLHGKNGEDVYIGVPLGTVVKDRETGRIICDIYYDGQKHMVLEGGNGGKGNVHFCTSRRRAPHFSQTGEKTEMRKVILELKTIADVGLIGFPNVGKSTILSKISAAKPKIANYHFTTLTPNLGVVKYYDDNFVCADIPGLIEGASEGTGLGTEFLRHIERTRVLVHVVDISGSEGRDPYEDYKKINVELRKYSKELAKRPQIVLLNKCDVYGAEENIKAFKKKLNYRREVFPVTAVTGEGLKEVVKRIVEILSELPAPKPLEFEEFSYEKDDPRKFTVTYDAEDNVYAIEGPIVKLLERNVVLDDMDSIAYMQKTLRRYGVIDALRKKGAKDGDTVLIGDIAFDYID